ncbi:MAG: cyclase family protein [Anaerolineae bacterium]|nr:cyclase family protein [Anaerolineae bacterium]
MLYDITRTITSRLAVWPGDAAYVAAPQMSLAAGESVNLTSLTFSPHTGAHADAYYHYESDGAHPAGMPLEAYIGPARVISVTKRDGALVPADFAPGALANVERLLIHSHVSDLPDDQFAETFPYLSEALIAYLAAQGTRLIGLDSPSVDAFDSKDLPCHHALKAHKMVNLECLYLRGVPDGDYELVALPLKLDAACGSPVRAILRELG